jgi:hypothetical protein
MEKEIGKVTGIIGFCRNCGAAVENYKDAIKDWKGTISRCVNCIGKGQREDKTDDKRNRTNTL